MIHFLGTVAMILVLSLMITGLLKLNYKDLWVSEDKKVAEPKVRTLRSCLLNQEDVERNGILFYISHHINNHSHHIRLFFKEI